MSTNIVRVAFIAAAILLAQGCGGRQQLGRADVTGQVTLDEKPLTEGMIYFIPIGGAEGRRSFATVSNGQFSAAGELAPVIGKHRVEIISTDDGGLAIDDEEAIARLKAEGRRRIQRVVVPPAYNQNSVLTAEITADGPNEFKFELSSKRRR